jgi:hypothetical protein
LPSNIVVVSGTSEANLALFGQEMDLFRVLQNLMNNGIFAMRESGGELRIFVERVIARTITRRILSDDSAGCLCSY